MSQPVVVPRHLKTCTGCVGSGTCWVCLGTGRIQTGLETLRCHRCGGTGLCAEMRPDSVDLPGQRASA